MSVPKDKIIDKPKPLTWAMEVNLQQYKLMMEKRQKAQQDAILYGSDSDTDDEADKEVAKILGKKV